jgi:hypothetical protein
MVTLAQVNFFILTDTFNMCHPSYESMSASGTLSFISANLKSQLIETYYAYLDVEKVSQ